MKALVILSLVLSAVLAEDVLRSQQPLSIVYRAQAGSARKQISAKLSLDCRSGDNGDQFSIVVAAVDDFIRSEKSSIVVVDQNQNVHRQEGSGDLTVSGNLKDLAFGARDRNCDESAGVLCGATRKGKVTVKQLIEVPNTKSKLHWTGFYEVNFECRLTPNDPAQNVELVSTINVLPLDQCINATHSASTARSANTNSYRMNIDLSNNDYKLMLDACALRTSAGNGEVSIIPFMENGMILNVPQMNVNARTVRGGSQYELEIENLVLPASRVGGGLKGVVDCFMSYCRSVEDNINLGVPACPSGDLARAAVSRSQFNLYRSLSSQAVTSELELEAGSMKLVVTTRPNMRTLNVIKKEC